MRKACSYFSIAENSIIPVCRNCGRPGYEHETTIREDDESYGPEEDTGEDTNVEDWS